MGNKLVVGHDIIAMKFDEKSCFSSILCPSPHWDYERHGEYLIEKIANLSTINKILLECYCIHGSALNGIVDPILFSFVIDKRRGNKVFFQPETKHYKK